MSYRKIDIVPGEYYHLYNRGANKQIIFKDEADYHRFLELLFLSNTAFSVSIRNTRREYGSVFEFDRGDEQPVAVGAYCLMQNHFHILVKPLIENGVEIFMRKILTGYSMYFNKRYKRTGTLFEGRYKSEHADSDEYLKYLFSYIHLNPLKILNSGWRKNGLTKTEEGVEYLSKYKYSSYIDFVNRQNREESSILTLDEFPEYFPNEQSFLKEIREWIDLQDEFMSV